MTLALPSSEIADRYNRGENTRQIAEHFHCSKNSIQRHLRGAGISLRNRGGDRSGVEHGKLRIATIIDLYANHHFTCAEIGARYNLSAATIANRLRAAGQILRKPGARSRADLDNVIAGILDAAEAGIPRKKIAQQLNCSYGKVCRVLNRNNIYRNRRDPARSRKPDRSIILGASLAPNVTLTRVACDLLRSSTPVSPPPAEGHGNRAIASSPDADQSPSLDMARTYSAVDPDDFGPMFVDHSGYVRIQPHCFFVGIHRAGTLVHGAVSDGVLQLRTTLGFLTYSDRNGASSNANQ